VNDLRDYLFFPGLWIFFLGLCAVGAYVCLRIGGLAGVFGGFFFVAAFVLVLIAGLAFWGLSKE
jgi:hypothetical protein